MPAMTGAPPGAVQSDPYALQPCPHHKIPQTAERFTVGPEPEVRTVKDKARMMERDLRDPYDVATVAGDSGINVASDPKSKYGPGMHGFGYSLGVGLGQDATSEMTNTFVIPSVTHQDPQYHREPDRSKMKRVEHAFADVAWTKSDKGKGMPNYSNIVGDAADDEVADFYVPGVKRGVGATAERYGVGLAMTPMDNLITEFAPDVASHIHVKSAFMQNIIDKVAGVATGAGPVAAARKHGGTAAARAPRSRH
jgi:hypothetical protein